jgi:hypothetical protein
LFFRGQEQTDSSLIEDPATATPQRLTPAKFSTAHVKGNASRVADRQNKVIKGIDNERSQCYVVLELQLLNYALQLIQDLQLFRRSCLMTLGATSL